MPTLGRLRGLGSFLLIAGAVFVALRVLHVATPLFFPSTRPGPLAVASLDEARRRAVPDRHKLSAALRQVLGDKLKVVFTAGEVDGMSPKAITDRKAGERQAAAVAEIREDPFVRELIEDFGGSLEENSIKPK